MNRIYNSTLFFEATASKRSGLIYFMLRGNRACLGIAHNLPAPDPSTGEVKPWRPTGLFEGSGHGSHAGVRSAKNSKRRVRKWKDVPQQKGKGYGLEGVAGEHCALGLFLFVLS